MSGRKKYVAYIIISVVSSYFLASLIPHVKYQDKYSYQTPSLFCKSLTFSLQPIMEVFASSKVTHTCHFKMVEKNQNYQSQLFVKSNSPQIRRLGSNPLNIFRNAIADLGVAKEAWVVEPEDFQGQWSLVFYEEQSQITQRSTLIHSGQIKILVDGEGHVWGENIDGEIIQLKLIKKTTVSSDKQILFI